MRLVTVRTADGTRAGHVEGDEIVLLDAADVGSVLAGGDGWQARAAAADGQRSPLEGADLAPVVPRPEKIVCVGLNYRPHIEEMGRGLPSHPTLFAKYTRALIGAHDPIVMPPVSDELDWEAELGVVIGRAVRFADPGAALEAVAGYTVVNDVSARDWQHRTLQFLAGKTFESTTPVGPALVTSDELPAGGSGLRISCTVDGQVMQDADTADLLFSVADIVSYVSQIVTLVPGDLIATGTPDGVGAGRRPPVFLRPGQEVRTTIEGVGELRNHCSALPG